LYLTATDDRNVGFAGATLQAEPDISSVSAAAPEAPNHGRCYTAFQIKNLICYFTSLESFALKLAPFDLKCGFADFSLIGMRAAPDNQVILRPLEQNLAPERRKKYGCLKRSLRGGLFCVPHNDCRWLGEAGCAEKRGS
jgi:hypothetical protein